MQALEIQKQAEQAEQAAAEALASMNQAGGSGANQALDGDQAGGENQTEMEETGNREFLEDPSSEDWSDEQDDNTKEQDSQESSSSDEEEEDGPKSPVIGQ